MSLSLAPVLKQRYFDSNGNPLAGGKLYTYQSGTSTPQVTYTDSGGLTSNSNPVILDANGEAAVWLDQSLSYKFVLKDSTDVTQFTVDNIIGILTIGAVNTEAIQDGAVTADKLPDGVITTAKTTVSVVTKTANYTLTTADDVVLANAASGTTTLTLPTAVGVSGRIYRVKKIDSSVNEVTIATTSAQTIDGITSRTMKTGNESYELVSDGANWQVIEHKCNTAWATSTTFTPSAGFGTISNAFWKTRRVTDSMEVEFFFSGTTIAASEASFTLPDGYVIDTAKFSAQVNSSMVGLITNMPAAGAAVSFAGGTTLILFYDGSTSNKIYMAYDTSTSGLNKSTVNAFSGIGVFTGRFTIPILGWGE